LVWSILYSLRWGFLCCELDVDCEGTLEPVCAFVFNLYVLVSTHVIRLAVKCEGDQNNETMVVQNKIVASFFFAKRKGTYIKS